MANIGDLNEISKAEEEEQERALKVRATIDAILKKKAFEFYNVVEESVEPFVDHYLVLLNEHLDNIYTELENIPVPDDASKFKGVDLYYQPRFQYELPVDPSVHPNVWADKRLREIAQDKLSKESNFMTAGGLNIHMRVEDVTVDEDPISGMKMTVNWIGQRILLKQKDYEKTIGEVDN